MKPRQPEEISAAAGQQGEPEGECRTRFTSGGSASGIWSPHGGNVLYLADDRKPAGGSGKDEVLFRSEGWRWAGNRLVVPTGGDRRPYGYTQGSTYSVWVQFSPARRWMAYVGEQFPRAQINSVMKNGRCIGNQSRTTSKGLPRLEIRQGQNKPAKPS